VREPEARAKVLFYGDDATGASDAMAQYQMAGLKSVLLFRMPARSVLARLAREYDVIGVSGVARALPTGDMESEIRPILEAFRELRPSVVQYKVCSTFDSSPERGSIGRAIEILRDVFGPAPVFVAPAQPRFGRYTVFGTHFARFGEDVYRLDRHPTMSVHPSTPMHEADLTQELARQTPGGIGLLELPRLSAPAGAARSALDQLLRAAPTAVVLDALTDEHLDRVAELVVGDGAPAPALVVGSGGVSGGVGRHLAARRAEPAPAPVQAVDRVLVVAGSASQHTAEQVADAASRGWLVLPVELADVASAPGDVLARVQRAVSEGLATGSVVVHTVMTTPVAESHRLAPALGHLFAEVLNAALLQTPGLRVVVAGGDTSSYTVRELQADGMELLSTQLAVGGALCRLNAPGTALDGAELLLKGGQVGTPDLFERVRGGRPL
jgi:uncharacterized protein YgbK (DUF1537 family)